MDIVSGIPKVIHYCWFGKKEKPDIVKKCISSWESILTDYELKEWNEDNFDIADVPYVHEAYNSGKFAFVSDYVRIRALYHFGGIYLDTDVEVLKPLDDFLHHESFWGFEQGNYIATSTIGAKPNNELIKRFIDLYRVRSFIKEDGTSDVLTNVAMVTQMFKELGVQMDGTFQEIKDLGVCYPQAYFSPYDYINCINKKNEQTYTIHYYYKSWLPYQTRIKSSIKRGLAALIGGENIYRLRRLMNNK